MVPKHCPSLPRQHRTGYGRITNGSLPYIHIHIHIMYTIYMQYMCIRLHDRCIRMQMDAYERITSEYMLHVVCSYTHKYIDIKIFIYIERHVYIHTYIYIYVMYTHIYKHIIYIYICIHIFHVPPQPHVCAKSLNQREQSSERATSSPLDNITGANCSIVIEAVTVFSYRVVQQMTKPKQLKPVQIDRGKTKPMPNSRGGLPHVYCLPG